MMTTTKRMNMNVSAAATAAIESMHTHTHQTITKYPKHQQSVNDLSIHLSIQFDPFIWHIYTHTCTQTSKWLLFLSLLLLALCGIDPFHKVNVLPFYFYYIIHTHIIIKSIRNERQRIQNEWHGIKWNEMKWRALAVCVCVCIEWKTTKSSTKITDTQCVFFSFFSYPK